MAGSEHTENAPHPRHTLHTVPPLPAQRRPGCPFDPPAELLDAHSRGPVSHYVHAIPGGKSGLMITGYEQVRAVLADPRFSSRKELLNVVDFEIPPAAPGEFLLTDEPEHSRFRKPLVGKFTVRRMRQLTERVEQITAECLDAMEQAGPTADLVSAFAKPIPAVIICELLGVPYEDRDSFQRQAESLMDGELDETALLAAYTAVQDYIAQLVAAKRAHPTDDILSELTTGDLSDEELKGVGLTLLAAGLDTTANTLALGTFALLENPEQLAALRADASLVDGAVEELLRYLSVAKSFMRTALEDVELDGVTVEAGTTVVISYHAANRDPERFDDPHTLDIRRKGTSHLAFGHGIHQCLGQQLARVEMRVALPALLDRFPTLRLAVPADEVPLRPESADIFGLKSLPVTWDRA
ncbi:MULTISPECIES: cytochrome P450 [unclassified Streptomyces]|uniref:cytochrome P450 n=1 Tax=unclassified Streptomyces TaxID=2593676 RepID=UPI00278C600E|nr:MULTISPECIES: cytochrome P450 [unclassified Streptomyces]